MVAMSASSQIPGMYQVAISRHAVARSVRVEENSERVKFSGGL
jgi:hypothetical protein